MQELHNLAQQAGGGTRGARWALAMRPYRWVVDDHLCGEILGCTHCAGKWKRVPFPLLPMLAKMIQAAEEINLGGLSSEPLTPTP